MKNALILPKPNMKALAMICWDAQDNEAKTVSWHAYDTENKKEKRAIVEKMLGQPIYKNIPEGMIVDGKGNILTCYRTEQGKLIETDVIPKELGPTVALIRPSFER